MMREIPPVCVPPAQKIQATIDDQDVAANSLERGSFSTTGSFCWLFSGSSLLVTSCERNEPTHTLCKTDLAQYIGDASLRITFVTELKDHLSLTDPEWNPFLLIVVLEREAASLPSSLITLFDVRLARLKLLIECPFSVHRVEPILVSEKGRAATLIDCLPPEIQCFHGAVLVGAAGGLVSILDLCLDQDAGGDVLQPRRLSYATRTKVCSTPDIDEKRLLALVHKQHVIYPLNCDVQSKNFFYYRTERKTEYFNMSATQITCLKFIPQMNAVCVAYNFTGFHVYDLKEKSILFNGDLDMSSAVVSFTFQEPENDPKNHCYLWMSRGSSVKGWSEDGVASVHLNVVTFQKKEWIPDFGYLYKDFVNSCCVFDYDCTGFPYLADRDNCSCSTIIECGTLELGSPWYLKAADDEVPNDLSLFFFVWEATNESNDTPLTYFAIFDINQYYQAQMPRHFTVAKDSGLCSFMAFFSLTEVLSQLPEETLLNFQIQADTIEKYRSSIYIHDLHYFPSALSFEASVLTEKSILRVPYFGIQKLIIARIAKAGPSAVVEPKDWLRRTYLSGLLPVDHTREADVSLQRQTLLLMMLQNDQLPFLISVVKSWCTGESDHIGCSISLISEWIWSQVSQTKTLIDQISQPLFNVTSREVFDENYAVKTLCSFEVDLKNLSLLLRSIMQHGTRLKDTEKAELRKRLDITERISIYLKVMLWMVDCHLLPERNETDSLSENEVAYPKAALQATYKERRKKLRALNPNIKSTDFLIIDGIIESIRDVVSVFWKKSGGSSLFPPPSIHALIGIYLLESVSLEHKHLITYYFLLDIASLIEDKAPSIMEKIKLFPTTFTLKTSLNNFVQGSWGLDNGLFDFAFPLLVDPAVRADFLTVEKDDSTKAITLKANIRQRIITCLVFQDNQVRAQQFDAMCRIAPNISPEDRMLKQKIHISVLLTNRHLLEAYEFWKRIKTDETADELLRHFLEACEQVSMLEQLFKLSLPKFVEERLMYYLMHISKRPQAKHLLALYHLSKNRVHEAEKILLLIRSQSECDSIGKLASVTEELQTMIDNCKATLPKAAQLPDEEDSEVAVSEDATSTPRKTRTTRKKELPDVSRTHGMSLRASARKKDQQV